MPRPGDNYFDNYAVSGYIQVGVWVYRGGTWSRFTTEDVAVYQDTGNNGGRQTVSWSLGKSYNFGPGVDDVGVTIEATDDTAAITSLGLSWSASSTNSERSATPSGESAIAVVRP